MPVYVASLDVPVAAFGKVEGLQTSGNGVEASALKIRKSIFRTMPRKTDFSRNCALKGLRTLVNGAESENQGVDFQYNSAEKKYLPSNFFRIKQIFHNFSRHLKRPPNFGKWC
jgi:hypothetical protein